MKQQCKFLLVTILFILVGCRNEDDKIVFHGEEAMISLSVRAVSSSINQDAVFWEDRVDELRMITFDSETGEVGFNEKIYFPDGFNNPSRAVRLRAGIYNMYFIANETVYSGDFVEALLAIRNESEFTSDSRFTNLTYNPAFLPDGTTTAGRFVMSAVYTDVAVTGGGTETNPATLILPTGKVELVRALAKVEVIFRKKNTR
ncbi:MAG: hypothetical protein LUH15_00780 [Tannerellaceae bacterium]|nr:hypothetical protein [Tannerellaceae bacterium]